MEKYSILTTVYKDDNPEYLKQSIKSMLCQTVITNDYVIVADGPLTEALNTVLDTYAKSYTFINIVRLPKNSGLGAALREGLKRCKNDLVARLDSDDISTSERCEIQLKRFSERPELAIVGSDMYEFEGDPEEIKDIKIMPHSSSEIYKFGRRRNAFNHSSVMYRKSIIEKNGNYSDMRRSQDLELFSKVIFSGIPCENIAKPLIKFRCGNSRIKRKKKWSNVKSDIRIFYNNYKMGYTSYIDFIYVVSIQIGFYIIPELIAGKLYTKFFRRKFDRKNFI